MDKKGKFIVVEGTDGTGKSTLVKKLAETNGWLATKQPGGSPATQQIRQLLLTESFKSVTMSEFMLFMASGVQDTASLIMPAISEGKTIICDRYFFSSLAYQGYANEDGAFNLMSVMIEHFIRAGFLLQPDLVVYLKADPKIALERSISKLKASGLDEGRFEGYGLNYQDRLLKGFHKAFQNFPCKIVEIDTTSKSSELTFELAQYLVEQH